MPQQAGRGASSFQPFAGWRRRSSQFFFLLIIFGSPIFSFRCQKGLCASPVEVAAVHLLSNGVNEVLVKAMLYPGAAFSKMEKVFVYNEPFSLPDWNHILQDMDIMTNVSDSGGSTPELGFLIGCYVCIIGAFFCIYGFTVISFCGMLILLWYIYKDGATQDDCFALPMFAVAMFCTFGGIKMDRKMSKEQTATEVPTASSAVEKKKN